jgi:hypothetical protein
MYFITHLLLVAASVASSPARLVHPIVVKRWENRQPSRFLFSIRDLWSERDWNLAKSAKPAAIFQKLS